jgi:hypothetical protein
MKPTLKTLTNSSNIPTPLIRAVVRQLGGWDCFTDSAPDIANHGIDGGFHGFIYYKDTIAFAKRNRAHIAEMAKEQASDFGTSVVEMIQSFGCFRNGSKPDEASICTAIYGGRAQEDTDTVLNALAWYAGEEVARAFQDMTESR